MLPSAGCFICKWVVFICLLDVSSVCGMFSSVSGMFHLSADVSSVCGMFHLSAGCFIRPRDVSICLQDVSSVRGMFPSVCRMFHPSEGCFHLSAGRFICPRDVSICLQHVSSAVPSRRLLGDTVLRVLSRHVGFGGHLARLTYRNVNKSGRKTTIGHHQS